MNHKQAIYRLILQKIILTSWTYSKKVGLSSGVSLGQNYQFLPTNYRQSVWETCLNTISIFAILFGEASTADIFFHFSYILWFFCAVQKMHENIFFLIFFFFLQPFKHHDFFAV